uniref:Uncharacterized protein n=1 Tax=viral metagenome TaxID=1070528 RepID=A0A6C0EFX9_9ZZZZ
MIILLIITAIVLYLIYNYGDNKEDFRTFRRYRYPKRHYYGYDIRDYYDPIYYYPSVFGGCMDTIIDGRRCFMPYDYW